MHVVVAVNKMDLVDWDEAVFDRICGELTAFVNRFDEPSLTFIPMSAKLGDNVVEPSANMPWYQGPPLLRYLEEVPARERDTDEVGARLPVQWVVEPGDGSSRPGLAGQLVSGVLRPGTPVTVLPSGAMTTVESVDGLDGPRGVATAGDAVTVRLADDVAVARGDLICGRGQEAEVADSLDALVCWMGDQPLAVGSRYVLKHASRWHEATVSALHYRLDVESLGHDDAASLGPNDIGSLSLRLGGPMAFDAYRANRSTGSFVLVDETTNVTVAAGMITGAPVPA